MGQRSIFLVIAFTVFAGILGLVFLLRGLSGRNQEREEQRQTAQTQVKKDTVTALAVVEDPLVYDGLSVTIEAPINDWVTKRAFTLSATGGFLGGGGRQLLVVSKTPFKLPKDTKDPNVGLGETVNVRLIGKARITSRAELSGIMGINLNGEDIKLDDNNIDNWEEGSVLLLTSVEKI